MTTDVTDSTLRTRIKSLLALADDTSEVVQKHVGEAIEHFDGTFDEICEKLQIPITDAQRESINLLMAHRQLHRKHDDIEYRQEHPLFKVGQVIKHRAYGYTGVIVAVDHQFEGKLEWYGSNKSHPDRNQPWYHILVNQSSVATYAAQSSIDGNIPFQEVIHPALQRFFNAHDGTSYLRNDEPWTAE